MADSQSLDVILAEVRFEKGVFRGTPAERRQYYRAILQRLESTISQADERLTEFWSHLEDDHAAWDTEHSFSFIENEFPRVLQMVATYRTMASRAKGSLGTITRFWKVDGYEHFSGGSYDLLKYVAQCAPFRPYDWCMMSIRQIIKERIQNPGRGISKSHTEQNMDWRKLADWIKQDQVKSVFHNSPYTPIHDDQSKRDGNNHRQKVTDNALSDLEEQNRRSYPERELFYVKLEPEDGESGLNGNDVTQNGGLDQRGADENDGLGENDLDQLGGSGGNDIDQTPAANQDLRDRQDSSPADGAAENGGLGENDLDQLGGSGRNGIDQTPAANQDLRDRQDSSPADGADENGGLGENDLDQLGGSGGNDIDQTPAANQDLRHRQDSSPEPVIDTRPAKRARRTRGTIQCTCPDFPEGPNETWKKEMKRAQSSSYDVEHRALLLSGIAWGDFNACSAHLKLMEGFLNLIPQQNIKKVKTNLRKYWKARYNIQDYIDNNAHLFQV